MPAPKFPRTREQTVVLQGRLYNLLVSELERALRFTVAPPLEMSELPSGRALTVRGQPQETVWAQITAINTAGNRFSWSEVAPTADAATPDDPDSWDDVEGGREGTEFVEPAVDPLGTASTVAVDDIVLLRRVNLSVIPDSEDPTPAVKPAWGIVHPVAGDTGIGFWFNISSVAAVGKYWAKAIVPHGTPIDPTADISFGSDFGLMPGDTVLLINAAELSNDTGTPWLSELMDDHIFFATPWGETNEDPPKGVWMIHGVHNGPCTA